jgi:hypothetical protein
VSQSHAPVKDSVNLFFSFQDVLKISMLKTTLYFLPGGIIGGRLHLGSFP